MTPDSNTQGNRRQFIKAVAAGSAVGLTGLSGCLGGDEENVTRSDPGSSDYETFIADIRDADPDAAVIGMTGEDLVIFLNQAAGQGLPDDVPIVTTTGSFRAIRAGVGDGAYGWDEGIYSGVRYLPSIDRGDNEEFVDAYVDEFDDEPDNFSRVGYESIRTIARAAQEAGTTDPTEVRQVLSGMEVDTIFGPVTYRECDQQATNPVWFGELVEPDEGEMADVDVLESLEGEDAAPDCADVDCDLSGDGDAGDGDVDFDELRLGVLEPLTGEFSDLGQERLQGDELAIEQINDSDEFDFEIVYEEYDTQTDPESGRREANNAIESFEADFLTGAISSSTALSINQVASQEQVVYTPGAADVSITGSNCNEYVFRFETHTGQIAELLAPQVTERFGTDIHYHIADYAYGDSVLDQVSSRIDG